MLNDKQREQLNRLTSFFTFVMENKLKGNFIVMGVGNGELGSQVRYESYFNLNAPKPVSEEEFESLLLNKK